jgi:site-specific recombinase XerD
MEAKPQFPGEQGRRRQVSPPARAPQIIALAPAEAQGRRRGPLHDQRHTFGTRTLRGSRNLKAVGKLLGHSDLNTTSKYAHVLMEDLRAAMESAITRPGAEKSRKLSRNR